MLEIVGREADGGRRCAPVGCGTARAGPPIGSGRGPTRVVAAAQARAFDTPVETSSPRSWDSARAASACFGTCVLRASACGLPIRPVLKHGPRSLTRARVRGSHESRRGAMKVKAALAGGRGGIPRPLPVRRGRTTGPSRPPRRGGGA